MGRATGRHVVRVTLPVVTTLVVPTLLLAGLGRASVQEGTRADASPSRVDLAATLRPLSDAQAESRAASGPTGTFTARLTPSGALFYRLSYRLMASGLSGRATSAHVHLGPAAGGEVVVTLCRAGGSGSGRCGLPAQGRIFVYKRSLVQMRALGAYVDIHTRRHPEGELRGDLIRPTPVWQHADRDSATGDEWTTAEVAGTDRRDPFAARMTLIAPKGRVGVQVLTECAQSGGLLHPSGLVNWRFVSQGRPIVRWLPATGADLVNSRACRWTVYALGGEGRMELAVETLRSVEP